MDPSTSNLLVCTACGTQFDTPDRSLLKTCNICSDPRQFVPPTGQSFTTLHDLHTSPKNYTNTITQISTSPPIYTIQTTPHLFIGQRCFLIILPQGNVLWDCITFLPAATIESINSLGGLHAIIISHPHYYTSHLEWAQTFSCPVYTSHLDREWFNRPDPSGYRKHPAREKEELILNDKPTGVKILTAGGHFPGSLLLLVARKLFLADTIVTTPSGRGDYSLIPPAPSPTQTTQQATTTGVRPRGIPTYTFQYSIPNMTPLSPSSIQKIWGLIRDEEFNCTYGAIQGMDVEDGDKGAKSSVKERILESMKIQVRRMGWDGHEFLGVSL